MDKRSVGSASIAFGLVVFQVKLYTSAQAESVSMRMLTPRGNPVKQKLVDSVTGEEVQHSDCSRGFEVEKDRFVVFTKEELKALEEEATGTMEVREFVPEGQIAPHQIEKTYYLDAGKGADKAYRLFAEALECSGRLAIAQWSARGRQHVVAIGTLGEALVAHQLFYADEVRTCEIACARIAGQPAEAKLAQQLVASLSVDELDLSKYRDGYRDRVMAAVEAKANGGTFTAKAPAAPAPTSSLLDALAASLGAAKPAPAKKRGMR